MMSPSNICSMNNKLAMAELWQPPYTDDMAAKESKDEQLKRAEGLKAMPGSRLNGKTLKKHFNKGATRLLSFPNIFFLITILLVFGSENVDGLKCHMCGQYNEGVGSITPCLSYSDQNASLYLKECSKKSEKFCVKYVSELSTVRDCATECVEKEVWETNTYCCDTDGCNGSNHIQVSNLSLFMAVLSFLATSFAGMNFGMLRR